MILKNHGMGLLVGRRLASPSGMAIKATQVLSPVQDDLAAASSPRFMGQTAGGSSCTTQ